MHNCRICDKEEEAHYMEPTKQELIDQGLCFNCHFWTEKLVIKDDSRTARVKGVHYHVGEEGPKFDPKERGLWIWQGGRGHGGAKFIIHFHDGRIVESTNLWCQGDIPDHFRDQLPDNAKFINSDERGKKSDKSPEMSKFLENLTGVSRDEAICSSCKRAVSMDSFRDELSRREFTISRLCQVCQDSVFNDELARGY